MGAPNLAFSAVVSFSWPLKLTAHGWEGAALAYRFAAATSVPESPCHPDRAGSVLLLWPPQAHCASLPMRYGAQYKRCRQAAQKLARDVVKSTKDGKEPAGGAAKDARIPRWYRRWRRELPDALKDRVVIEAVLEKGEDRCGTRTCNFQPVLLSIC